MGARVAAGAVVIAPAGAERRARGEGRVVSRLRAGMRVGIVAPASPVGTAADADAGVSVLRDLGLEVEFAADPARRRGHLAGTDAQRAGDLAAMLARPDIDAVVCLRGGEGTLRTLLALPPDLPERLAGVPPKAVVGFSDVTLLHAWLAAELGWASFHGPGLTSLAVATAYTRDAFVRALFATGPFDIGPAPDGPAPVALVPGRTEGLLAGGCLSLLVSLLGTPWAPDLTGRILFFEDTDEQPYRIDRMLSQLLAAGQLQRCAGIVVGEHVRCDPRDPARSLTLEEVVADLLVPLGVPLLAGLPLGHGRHLATVPLGRRALLDAGAGRLRVLDPGVR